MEKVTWKDGHMIRVSEEEALKIIESLSHQLRTRNPNEGRKEFTLKDGEYFSISVHKEEGKIKLDRYFLDIRNGIGAIRDREHPRYDPEYQGLQPDTPDVVSYVFGIFKEASWQIPEEDLVELTKEFQNLQSNENTSRK